MRSTVAHVTLIGLAEICFYQVHVFEILQKKKKNHCLLPINKFPVSRFVSLKGEKTRCENHVYTETMIETYHTVDLRYSTLQLRLPRLPWSCVWITCKILTRISDGTNTNCSWSEFWTIFCQVWLDLHWSLGMVTTS